MKVVIDIDENLYTRLFDNGVEFSTDDKYDLERSVRHGKVLPKGHGSLMILSENKVKENQVNLSFSFQKWIDEVDLSNATVAIIEADTTESEE